MDFLVADGAALDAQLAGQALGHGQHFRIVLALAAFIDVHAAPALLAVAAEGVQLVGQAVVAGVAGQACAQRGADQVADVDADQVVHAQHAHGQTEVCEYAVDLCRGGAFQQQAMGFAGVGLEHAVADEAVTHPGNHRQLADLLAQLQCGGQHVQRGFLAAHHFEQAHDVGRAEEVQADHVLRTTGAGGNLVDVEGRSVAGEDGAGLAHLVEGSEHLALDLHALEYCLDHQVGIGQVGVVEGAQQQRHALLELLLAELAALGADLVVLADLRQAAIQRLALLLEQHHWDADVDEVHGDATAHGAGTDHRDLADFAQRQRGVDAGHLAGLTLGEEQVAQGLGLRRLHGFGEQFRLALQADRQRQFAGALYCRQDLLRRQLAAPLVDLAAGIAGEEVGGQRSARLGVQVGRLHRGACLQQFASEGAGRVQQGIGAGGQTVDQTQFEGARSVQWLAGEDRFQGRFGADQARQALGAAGTGNQAEGDFRQAEARLGLGDPVAAGHGQLQAATEGQAADRGDHRLGAGGQLDEQIGQARSGGEVGTAELGDIGAGAEGQVAAVDHHGLDRRVGTGLAEGGLQLQAQGVAEGVDRGAGQADQGQFVIQGVIDQGIHGEPLQQGWPVRRRTSRLADARRKKPPLGWPSKNSGEVT